MDVGYPGAPAGDKEVGSETPRRLLHAYGRAPIMRRIAFHENVRRVICELMEDEAVMLSQCHHNCVMTKFPKYSSVTGWHQDIRYWHFDFPELVSVWIAIEQEDKLNKLKKDRESLGSVNLRADVETEKYRATIKKMEDDRTDLVSAIVKLKSSISELNQRGRERLLDAFNKVNRKFNEVFTKLFNGGNAKLELVDSDDPLEAGLEMLVSPPGKRLQSITLLSGGEQALTAISLIFAIFLTNPSPICILDEVDAPLDDANVTRFCSLLDQLISITKTKFIIITHHALTMSKMNRLYGVTTVSYTHLTLPTKA